MKVRALDVGPHDRLIIRGKGREVKWLSYFGVDTIRICLTTGLQVVVPRDGLVSRA
jgi:hypothetical protein